MLRRSVSLLSVLPALFLIAGCGEEPAPMVADVSRPVKTLLVLAPETGSIRSFPARIDADRKAELAFRVSGKVKDLPVKEGDRVEKGQEVGRLDPKDFQIVVNDRQATFDKAEANFTRAEELIGKGYISKVDYDRLEAEFKNARASLEAARQDLSYTVLKAPFAGAIAQRHIERFEEVQAKQAVLSLQDTSLLDVKFDVPETVVRSIRTSGETLEKRKKGIKVFASFDDLPGQQFPLVFKEAATKADSKTQTFAVTYSMEQVQGVQVLPGMTATVTVDLSRYVAADDVFTVPASAVVGDYKLEPRVWVVNESTMTVKSLAVKVGRMLGDSIEVTDGLETGTRIVTAGTPFLVENMKVTFLPDLEQAAPRPGEPRE